MLAKRIVPCLDVKDGKVVKGVRFRGHDVVGDITDLAQRYRDEGADELVFYDITASAEDRAVDTRWVRCVADLLDMPFCVAGGIRTVDQARHILYSGADKISLNSPALENPSLVDTLAREFGSQCIVIGIDSFEQDGFYRVHQYTGDVARTFATQRLTFEWAREVVDRGAGEIVLNCMNRDGVRQGYDLAQLKSLRDMISVPLVASGGAGAAQHFYDVFTQANVDGALAASVFHKGVIGISDLKKFLKAQGVRIRP
ncbi:MAG: imidazole glycerol phosphate synthase subunit HisF [Pseudomonadota bacterium]